VKKADRHHSGKIKQERRGNAEAGKGHFPPL
jgi:hypothetical protein